MHNFIIGVRGLVLLQRDRVSVILEETPANLAKQNNKMLPCSLFVLSATMLDPLLINCHLSLKSAFIPTWYHSW
jgi:hypothetical protein